MILSKFCEKEIVSIKTGASLGSADDFEIDEATSKIKKLVICTRARLFGLLGKSQDIIIPWEDIESIGLDVILVKTDIIPPQRKNKG